MAVRWGSDRNLNSGKARSNVNLENVLMNVKWGGTEKNRPKLTGKSRSPITEPVTTALAPLLIDFVFEMSQTPAVENSVVAAESVASATTSNLVTQEELSLLTPANASSSSSLNSQTRVTTSQKDSYTQLNHPPPHYIFPTTTFNSTINREFPVTEDTLMGNSHDKLASSKIQDLVDVTGMCTNGFLIF